MEELCAVCFNEHSAKKTYGFINCFPKHEFCMECLLQVWKKKYICPFDKRENNLLITLDDNGTVIHIEDFMLLYLSKFVSVEKITEEREEKIRTMVIEGRFPMGRCLGCLLKITDEEIFRYDSCRGNHEFCDGCIRRNEGVCPVEMNELCLRGENGNKITLEIDLVNILHYLRRNLRNLSKFKSIQYEIHSSRRYPLRLCINCLSNIDNEKKFGYGECFDKHRMCVDCAIVHITSLVCPVDRLTSNCVMVEGEDESKEVMSPDHLELSLYISGRSDIIKARSLLKEIYTNQECAFNVCTNCLKYVKYGTVYGYKHCFNKHRTCLNCAKQFVLKGECCPIDKRTSFIVAQCKDKEMVTVDKNLYLMFKYTCEVNVKRDTRKNILGKILERVEYPADICMTCLKDIKGKMDCGQTLYFGRHRQCKNCDMQFEKDPIRNGFLIVNHEAYIPIGDEEGDIYKKITVEQNDGKVINVETNLHLLYKYFKTNFKNSERTNQIIEEIFQTNQYPLHVCTECLVDLRSRPTFGYERCFNEHRVCTMCILKCKSACYCRIHKRFSTNYKMENMGRKSEIIDYKFIEVMKYLNDKLHNSQRAQNIIERMIDQFAYPLDVCIVCLCTFEIELSFGYNFCYHTHRMCEICLMKGLCDSYCGVCCLDHAIIMVQDSNKQWRVVNWKILSLLKFINTNMKNLEKASFLLKRILMDGKCPLDVCIVCLEDIKGASYGYNGCFDIHRFCAECIISKKHFSGTLYGSCDIDQQRSTFVKMEREDRTTSVVELSFLWFSISANDKFKESNKWKLVRKHLLETLEYPLDICVYCLKDLDGNIIYGNEICFDKHRFCEKCAILTVPLGQCEICQKWLIRMVIDRPSIGVDSVDFEFMKMVKSVVQRSGEDETEGDLVRNILTNLSFPKEFCRCCFSNLGDAMRYSFDPFYIGYRFCKECLLNKDLSQFVDIKRSRNINIESLGTSSVTDIAYYKTLKYLNDHSKDTTNQVIDEMMFTLKYPLEKCVTCLISLQGQMSYGYQDCVDYHRFCEECLSTNMSIRYCCVDNIFLTHNDHRRVISAEIVQIKSGGDERRFLPKKLTDVINTLNRNSKDGDSSRMLIKQMLTLHDYPLENCIQCMKSFKELTIYGYECCFKYLRLCELCSPSFLLMKCHKNHCESTSIKVEPENMIWLFDNM